MPGYSNKRSRDMTNKNWGGRQNQRRDDRRGNLQNRIGGIRPMLNPWENGVTPGMQPSLMSQTFAAQPMGNSYLLSSGLNRGMTSGYGYGNNTNKMRRLDRMGGFDDERGRGLLPSPSAPLLGVAPPAFPPPSRVPDYLHQRMGNPWESFHSGGPRSMSSLYYPSNRGRQDNRKFIKAKRVNNKSSSSTSTTSKGNSSSKEGKGGRSKGGTTPKSPSTREREDKDKDSSHSKDAKNKQGDSTPEKSERSEKEGEEENKDEVEIVEEVVKEDIKEEEKKDDKEDKTDKDKPQLQEDPFPVKALYCHICELDSFSSKKGYIRHLQGITHAKMAEIFHAKNAATLELLNISAKLAEMRQRDKTLRRTGKKGQPVMKTTEQILVQKWLKVGSCCGTKYKSPFGLEEHKLSIHHLKAKHLVKEKEEAKDLPEGECVKEMEKPKEGDDDDSVPKAVNDVFAEDTHDLIVEISKMLEEAEKEAVENPLTMDNLPVYDPAKMIGLEYIKKELRFHCTLCKGPTFKTLETHCQSHSHYDNIASHLNKVEDMKREEQRKKEEAEAEEKRKQQEKEKAQEAKKKAEAKKAKDDEDNQEEFVTIDDTKMRSEDEQEEMDEDVIPIGEEEERILNEKSVTKKNKDQEEEEEEELDEELEENIFEEVGEKIDFGEDLKKQLENGKGGDAKKKGGADDDEEVEVEPPPKKTAYTPRGRRSRSRGRGRSTK